MVKGTVMSNENNNERRRQTRQRWILLIGGVFIIILLIFVIRFLPGPTIGTIFTRIPPNLERIENNNLNENQNATDTPESALASITEEPDPDSSSNAGPESSSDTSPGVGPESFIDTPEPGEPALPPAPAQVAEVTCTGPPSSWIAYTIQAGDTLTALALTSGSSVIQLQRANCLTDETLIAGALFYLPQIPPSPTAVRAPATVVPTITTNETAVAAVVPTITLLPPTPVPVTTTTLPEESNSLLWFLWVVMLVLLVGALIWVWQQRRQTR